MLDVLILATSHEIGIPMSVESSSVSNEIDNSIKEVSHIIRERYFSNKWFFSTIITILLLNGKGVFYFIFAPLPEKLLIIKGFEYGAPFLMNDVFPSLIFSAMFLTVMPRLAGFVNEKVFYKSEMYQRNIDMEFLIQQQYSKGQYINAEIINGKEYKTKEIQFKLEKSVKEYESMCERADSLERRNNTLNEINEKLKMVNLHLEDKLKHNSYVCEQVKSKANGYLAGTSRFINKFFMDGRKDADVIVPFEDRLNKLSNEMTELLQRIDNDKDFKTETIGS